MVRPCGPRKLLQHGEGGSRRWYENQRARRGRASYESIYGEIYMRGARTSNYQQLPAVIRARSSGDIKANETQTGVSYTFSPSSVRIYRLDDPRDAPAALLSLVCLVRLGRILDGETSLLTAAEPRARKRTRDLRIYPRVIISDRLRAYIRSRVNFFALRSARGFRFERVSLDDGPRENTGSHFTTRARTALPG